jgi:hypothetical protein
MHIRAQRRTYLAVLQVDVFCIGCEHLGPSKTLLSGLKTSRWVTDGHEDDGAPVKLEAMSATTSAPIPQIVATIPIVAQAPLANSLVPKTVVIPTHQLAVHHNQATSGSDIVIDKEKMTKAEYRRARR